MEQTPTKSDLIVAAHLANIVSQLTSITGVDGAHTGLADKIGRVRSYDATPKLEHIERGHVPQNDGYATWNVPRCDTAAECHNVVSICHELAKSGDIGTDVMDSLDMVEFIMMVEETTEFEISDEDAEIVFSESHVGSDKEYCVISKLLAISIACCFARRTGAWHRGYIQPSRNSDADTTAMLVEMIRCVSNETLLEMLGTAARLFRTDTGDLTRIFATAYGAATAEVHAVKKIIHIGRDGISAR